MSPFEQQEVIFTNHTSERGLMSKINKEHKELDINKPVNPIEKWGTNLNRILNRVFLHF